MRRPRIHGLIMARDEWPLLELAITHALVHLVDRVHVLDHASTDGTAAGLVRLGREWGDRLTVTHLGESPYLQEAATSLLREIAAPAPDDWLYVFDADEFGIAGTSASLRELLADVDERHVAARYEVHNWVAPADFSADDPVRYAELRHRAVASVFVPVPAPVLVDEIMAGAINYFDVPFLSKVVIRATAAGWIAAGSHRIGGAHPTTETRLPADAFRVAHLPFLDRRRLRLRVAQGRSYRRQGFPVEHGWQSQMLVAVADDDGLDSFWARHSLAPSSDGDLGAGPAVVRDDSLAAALEPTITRVLSRRPAPAWHDQARGSATPADSATLLPIALRTIRGLQADVEELGRQRDAALALANAAVRARRMRFRSRVRGLRARCSLLIRRTLTRWRRAFDEGLVTAPATPAAIPAAPTRPRAFADDSRESRHRRAA